ncbi:hypothetical protein C8A03DRAFT_19120 [Achaetomium macrosporum]|uniref:Trichothecene 3-O-acetyltransferase-like N-terminal domain-containing protein n=1 Tax=Achaetomium macrosporum TaxID=79813 RepID=A0AAN7H7K7_9PEZI|nr:hypothetical protein C8A03DRAFT_19120 [Achaetomium macrosporum]
MGDISEDATILALSPLDNLMVPCWVKLLFYFPLPVDASVSETYELLRKGLSMAVADMPICGGTVHFRPQDRPGWKPNQLEVRIPKAVGKNGIFPLDLKDLRDQLSYEDLRKAGFDPEHIDTELLMTRSCNTNLAAGIEAVAAQANYVKGGCLLGLAVWHNVADAHGTYIFARTWASHCRKLQTEPGYEAAWKANAANLAGTGAGNGRDDRTVLAEMWEQAGKPGAATDRQWSILGLFPPSVPNAPRLNDVLAALMSGAHGEMKKVRSAVFSVAESSLEQLRRDAAVSARTNITSLEALHALLWRCTMKARYPLPADNNKEEPSIYQIALDGRSRLGGDPFFETYLGDAFFFATSTLPLTTVLGPSSAEALGALAETLHATLDGISRADLLAAFGAAHDLDGYANLAYSLAGVAGASMIVVPQDYISLPTLDFGPAIGTPDCERPPGDEWNCLFRRTVILPAASGKGLEVLVSLYEEEMQKLKADGEFVRYAKVSSG